METPRPSAGGAESAASAGEPTGHLPDVPSAADFAESVPDQPSGVDGPEREALSARDRRILGFEGERWRYPGAKEQAIRAEFGISATRYYQILNALLDRPEALRHDPVLINRLRRLRDARKRARSGRQPPTAS